MYPNQINSVQPRPALSKKLGVDGTVAPVLFGVNVNRNLGVIYSPYGLSCGWELAQCPYCAGVVSKDAIALGINILSYASLH